MKELWIPKDKCTACGACQNMCPVDAIEMADDGSGFIYPRVTDKCISCNQCEEVCNERTMLKCGAFVQRIYAARSKNEGIRFESTSGGIFSELANYILKEDGYIVGAAYNDRNLVEHALIKSDIELATLRKSKYVQSIIGNIYREIKHGLEENRKVLFCGAPCQVAGLKAFLGKDYGNLYTMDFICRGMNSIKAYESWLNELEECQKCKVKNVWFKYKQDGWKDSPLCTRIDFEDGSNRILKKDDNLFMRGYLGPNIYIRPSCGDCDFKGEQRLSDITVADFWKNNSELDDDKGLSMVLINSEKGNELYNCIKDKISYERKTMEDVKRGNKCFESSVYINKKTDEFMNRLDIMRFSEAIERYL